MTPPRLSRPSRSRPASRTTDSSATKPTARPTRTPRTTRRSGSPPTPKTGRPPRAHRTQGEYRAADRGRGRVLARDRRVAGGFGFSFTDAARPDAPPGDGFVRARRGAHGVVYASTGSGKLVNISVPLILDHVGPLIQFDPKHEATPITERERARHGPVFTLDPFNVRQTGETDALNPFDLLRLPGVDVDAQARSIAEDLGAAYRETQSPYWPISACELIAAVIVYVNDLDDPDRRTLATVIEVLLDPDIYENLACLAALDGDLPDHARRGFVSFLAVPDSNNGSTRSCILHFARTMIAPLVPAQVAASLGPGSTLMRLLLDGDTAFTLNVVFPAENAVTDAALLNLYLTVLTRVISARRTIPPVSTLMLVDEAGNLPQSAQYLPALHTYARGKGCEIVTLWQSLAQMQTVLGTHWRTLIENCGTVQAFGLHPTAVAPLAELLDVPADLLRNMDDQHMAVLNGTGPVEVLPRVDYRTSPYFTALDPAPNPYYANLPTPPGGR